MIFLLFFGENYKKNIAIFRKKNLIWTDINYVPFATVLFFIIKLCGHVIFNCKYFINFQEFVRLINYYSNSFINSKKQKQSDKNLRQIF